MYTGGEKTFKDMFIGFDRIYERDRQTDGQTDRRTPHEGLDEYLVDHGSLRSTVA